ncbi:MAG: hypothetical protein JO215_10015 [Ktedonobacteraceae bacterium]|nr:hypothetical protein [Ktedonobacteraceae bacterium]
MRKNNQKMVEDAQTWRDLLRKVAAKPDERHRIATALRINSITITRWITGTSNPRAETLRALPRVLPEYREQLITLLRREYAHLFADEPVIDMPLDIPPAFYSQMLNIYSMHPECLRASTLGSTILQQIVEHFDPDDDGFAAFIAQCVPPHPDHKVRSLRITVGIGGPVHYTNRTCFCGAESQAGLAALHVHHVTIQNPEEAQRLIPAQHVLVFGSSLAIPIVQYDHIAGCACFVSPQKDYFTSERVGLLKRYVDLLTIAFEPGEFYHLSDINLAMMPIRSQQASVLADLQDRITSYMLIPTPEGRLLSRQEAEQRVLKEKEEALIQIVLASEQRSEVYVS